MEHFGDPVANLVSGDFWNQSLGIVACNLCRYIRIFTYPTVIISLVALYYNDVAAIRSIKTLAVICLLFCIYKYGLEMKLWSNGEDPFLCVN